MNIVACIVYHKNALSLYEKEWVEKCINSLKEQTFQEFDFIEINYGGGEERFTDGTFFSIELDNFISAMNFLLTYAFGSGYEIAMNCNLDDFYEPDRFEKQIEAILNGAQLVSSNFRYFGARDKEMNMTRFGNIGQQLAKGHNVIAHPVVAMHRSFWDADLHYENVLGSEDLRLWQKAYRKGKKFVILPECLLFYRLHPNQVTKVYTK